MEYAKLNQEGQGDATLSFRSMQITQETFFAEDYSFSTDDEKAQTQKDHAERLGHTGLLKCSRGHKSPGEAPETKEENKKSDPTKDRVKEKDERLSNFFTMTFSYGNESTWTPGRADDGGDKTIVSPQATQCALSNGIRRLMQFKPRKLQEALKTMMRPSCSTSQKIWTPPRKYYFYAQDE